MTLGASFSISDEQRALLMAAKDNDELFGVMEEIEEGGSTPHFDFDKSWDALHRCLTDGTLDLSASPSLLARAVVNGDALAFEDADGLVMLTDAEVVPAVAEALAAITPERLTDLYWTVLPRDYAPEYGSEDLAYILETLAPLQHFWNQTSLDGRHVVFSIND